MPVFGRRAVMDLARRLGGLTEAETEAGGRRRAVFGPENVIWIFGTGRGGSTWLRSMMGELRGFRVWEEPMVGRLFGDFYDKAQEGQRTTGNFVLGEPHRQAWIKLIREFVLGSIACRAPDLGPRHYLVVKEPHGSVGAPLLMEALPESRMVLLARDPRDVVASNLDAMRRGGWLYERLDAGGRGEAPLADTDPDAAVERRARNYLRDVGKAREAYDLHGGPKAVVRYEDLVSNTLGTMRRTYEAIRVPVDEGELVRAVEKHSWEMLPEEKKGKGKFYRKGSPGSWREDLTPDQARAVEEITAPLLREFYPS